MKYKISGIRYLNENTGLSVRSNFSSISILFIGEQ